MPATDQIWRPLPMMHRWFAGSMIVLTLATWLMLRKDEQHEWREYQRQANLLKEERLMSQLAPYSDAGFLALMQEADERVATARTRETEQRAEINRLDAEIKSKSGEYQIAQQRSKFRNAERDFRRAAFDLDVRDARSPNVLDQTLALFNADQVASEVLAIRVQKLGAELDELKEQRDELTGDLELALAERKLLLAERDRLAEQLAQISPASDSLPEDQRSRFSAAKRMVKEWPILNAFNPHLKIQYDWPSLQGAKPAIQIGMARVQRVDRCRSCHVNISDFTAPTDAQAHEPGGDIRYAHPLASHPRPELFLSSSSPHSLESFGCTICHLGDGSGTSFQNAEHSPSDPAMARVWAKDHNWHSNHFWEQPMLPSPFIEATCIKCHHNVVELGVNAKFGPTAPKAFEGYNIIKEFGCFGCHPINGFDGTRSIGPDLRLEPQTEAEALAIAADPNQTAGRERKVGPSLTHIGQKVDKNFISYWTEEPKRFRPDTRMPQFFHLSNQEDHLAGLLQPVELAGIAAYLEAKSQPLQLEQPQADYVPNMERGKVLFGQRGCLACHSHDDDEFYGIDQNFGPNLSKIHEKIKPGEEGFNWLYTWLKNPELHHPRTRMPNLFLNPEGAGDSLVDPAADIAAFLLAGGPGEFPEMKLPSVYLGVVVQSTKGGVRVIEVLPDSPAERALLQDERPGQLPALRVGDVITAVNGQTPLDQSALDAQIAGLANGAIVDLSVTRGGQPQMWSAVVTTPLDDLVRLYLGKSLSAVRVEQTFTNRQFPVLAEMWLPRPDGTSSSPADFIKGDEIELAPKSEGEQVDAAEWEARKLQYIGRRTIARYGCYGCHDIPGFEEGRPIGTALQDWGRKDTSQLAAEHIEEFLHHHGEPDGSSTSAAVKEIVRRQYNDGNLSHEERLKAYFYDSLQHHGRPGFLWQKLREPRSYDYMKTSTKGWDERLRMPKFPFSDQEIESVTTFVLGLVADPPDKPYLYQPEGPQGAIVEGERLLAKFNCGGCHILDMPSFQYNINLREFVGLTRPEIVGFLSRHADHLRSGALTQAMLAGRESVPDELWETMLAQTPANRREAVKASEQDLLSGLASFITNCETLLAGQVAGVDDLTKDIAPLLGRLAKSREAVNLEKWLDAHPETLIADNIGSSDYADAVRLSLKLKPPVSQAEPTTSSAGRKTITFHGLHYMSDPDFGEDTYDSWANLEIGGRYKLSGINSRFIANEETPVTGKIDGRGGEFMIWLYNKIALDKAGGEPSLMAGHISGSQQASPPPLYKEGIKVQTPWLYQFLKNPEQLRYTTVLRMPRFNLSDEEALALANYFAAVDGVPFPYQDVTRRDPDYLNRMERLHAETFQNATGDYQTQAWKLLNANQCIKCHSVGGRKFQSSGQVGPDGQPTDVQGPNLKRVQDRLRPDWTQLWLYNPKWITPYTSMPVNLPRDQKNFPELFGADGHWQNPALIDALMNYGALYERLGTVIYDPAPAAAGEPAAETTGDATAPPPTASPDSPGDATASPAQGEMN